MWRGLGFTMFSAFAIVLTGAWRYLIGFLVSYLYNVYEVSSLIRDYGHFLRFFRSTNKSNPLSWLWNFSLFHHHPNEPKVTLKSKYLNLIGRFTFSLSLIGRLSQYCPPDSAYSCPICLLCQRLPLGAFLTGFWCNVPARSARNRPSQSSPASPIK